MNKSLKVFWAMIGIFFAIIDSFIIYNVIDAYSNARDFKNAVNNYSNRQNYVVDNYTDRHNQVFDITNAANYDYYNNNTTQETENTDVNGIKAISAMIFLGSEHPYVVLLYIILAILLKYFIVGTIIYNEKETAASMGYMKIQVNSIKQGLLKGETKNSLKKTSKNIVNQPMGYSSPPQKRTDFLHKDISELIGHKKTIKPQENKTVISNNDCYWVCPECGKNNPNSSRVCMDCEYIK